MKRYFIISLMFILFCSAVFSGCSNYINNDNGIITYDENEEITVVIYHYMSQKSKCNALETLEELYIENHPNVTFENNLIVQTNYFSTIRQLVASGEAPDIIMGQPSQYPDIIDTGIIMDLSDYEGINDLGLSDYDKADCSYNGKLYAFPFDFKTYGVFYNKDIFEMFDLEVPKNHAELIAICEKLENAGIDPWIRCYNDAVYPDIEIRAYFWPSLIESGQTNAWSDLMNGSKKFSDYPEWEQAIKLWTERMHYTRYDDLINDQTKSYDVFCAGEGAMYYQGTWAIGDMISRNPQFEIGFFAMPTNEGLGSFPLQIDDVFMVNGKTKGGEVAADFLSFCLLPENAAIWSEEAIMPSLIPGADTSQLPEYLQEVIKAKEEGRVAHAGAWEAQIYGEFISKYRQYLMEYAADQISGDKTYTSFTFTKYLETKWAEIVAKTE